MLYASLKTASHCHSVGLSRKRNQKTTTTTTSTMLLTYDDDTLGLWWIWVFGIVAFTKATNRKSLRKGHNNMNLIAPLFVHSSQLFARILHLFRKKCHVHERISGFNMSSFAFAAYFETLSRCLVHFCCCCSLAFQFTWRGKWKMCRNIEYKTQVCDQQVK